MRRYCPKCRVWAYKTHKCPESALVDTDTELKFVVQRLYDMGIQAESATWGVRPKLSPTDEDRIDIRIDLRTKRNAIALGDLPAGWMCLWDLREIDVYIIGYSEIITGLELKSVKECAIKIINEFEEFLNEKDSEAVKALLLLTTG